MNIITGAFAVIPMKVLHDDELTPNAKLIYAEIGKLTNDKGYCYASNLYFAERYKVSKVSVSKWINLLIKKGYLKHMNIYRDGTKMIIQRRLYINIENINQDTEYRSPIKEKLNTPLKKSLTSSKEMFKDNSISNNSIRDNNKKNKQKKVSVSSNDFTTEIKAKEKSVLEAMKDLNIDLSKFSSKDLEVLNSVGNTVENREALDIEIKAKTKKESVNSEHVERIYKAYPTTCPIKKSTTGKSRKVGQKKSKQILIIEQLLKTFNVSDLETYTKKYISDCKHSKTFIKNFQTFLNSIKDNGIPTQEEQAPKEKKLYIWSWWGQSKRTGNKAKYEKEKRMYEPLDIEFTTHQIGE